MFILEIKHNVRFLIFEQRRAIFSRSKLKMDKNGRDGSIRQLCVASRDRDLYSCDAFLSSHR